MKALKFDAESRWTAWDRGARLDSPEIKEAGSYSTYCGYRQMDVPRLSKTGIPEDLVKRSIQSAFLKLGYATVTSDHETAITEFS